MPYCGCACGRVVDLDRERRATLRDGGRIGQTRSARRRDVRDLVVVVVVVVVDASSSWSNRRHSTLAAAPLSISTATTTRGVRRMRENYFVMATRPSPEIVSAPRLEFGDDLFAVRLTLRELHHLTDEELRQLLVPVAEPRPLVGVLVDQLVATTSPNAPESSRS